MNTTTEPETGSARRLITDWMHETFPPEKLTDLTADTPLIGGNSVLDSMKLVELCLYLEDQASDMGFEFDWTSETAMSKSRSIFRTIGSLADEFHRQQAEPS